METTNACNYRCVMCPRETMTHEVGFMDDELYKKIIDEACKLGVQRVRLHFYGEPLLHKNLIERIKYAKRKGLFVDIDTNAELLTPDLSEKLVNSGIDQIIISFHGLTPEEYKHITGRDSFGVITKNITHLIKIKEIKNIKKPKIIIQTTIMDINYKNVHKVFNYFPKDKVEFSVTNCNYNPLLMKNDYRHIKFEYNRKVPCLSLYNTLVVSWDGNVTVCCSDVNFNLSIGHIEDGIINLFNNDKIKKLRKYHLFGKFDKLPLCKKCIDPIAHSLYMPIKIKENIICGKYEKNKNRK
ncbi:radical SAM/SPASM domain-containing protein [Methanococcus aeolicus]|nr:radical SAM protein [Methanococcus aeolicus]